MAKIEEDDTFTQIVRFDVDPKKQSALIAAIVAEVERWVCRRPGFISSTFHASHDGRHVINYAQWQNEAAFRAFTQDPEGESLKSAIRGCGPIAGAQCRALPRGAEHRLADNMTRSARNMMPRPIGYRESGDDFLDTCHAAARPHARGGRVEPATDRAASVFSRAKT